METQVKDIATLAAHSLEIFGIVIIVLYVAGASLYTLIQLLQGKRDKVYTHYRRQLGLGILLGLEILIAADIILTVAVDFDLRSVGVLALIVLVRTFLSFTLTAEIEGKWPWQQGS